MRQREWIMNSVEDPQILVTTSCNASDDATGDIDTSPNASMNHNHHQPPPPSSYQEMPSTTTSQIDVQTPSTSTGGQNGGGGGGDAPAYDDMFPALPDDGSSPFAAAVGVGPVSSSSAISSTNQSSGAPFGNRIGTPNANQASRGASPGMTSAAGNKMKVRSTNVTQVFKVAPENRRHLSDVKNKVANADNNMNTGHPDHARVCRDITAKTQTAIELCNSKDGTLTFLITGKEENVAHAKRLIAAELQTQTTSTVRIPKAHHRFILGKNGKKLTDLQDMTGTKISIPRQDMTGSEAELIKIVGTKEGIEKAAHEMRLISNEIASKSNERLEIEVINFNSINTNFINNFYILITQP